MEPPPAPQPYHSVPAPPPTAFAPYGQPQGFDYGAQVCNTPTAAAALSALGGRRGGGGTPAAAGTAQLQQQVPAADEPIATEVICNGMLGQLLLKAPPLRIRVPATGAPTWAVGRAMRLAAPLTRQRLSFARARRGAGPAGL
jgi:hypothetical protein